MSLPIAVTAGRAAAEKMMADTCTITRSAPAFTDPVTGRQAHNVTTLYSGKCRIKQQSQGDVRTTDAGEADHLMLRLELQLPMSATGFRVTDEVVINTSQLDPDLAGRKFRIRVLDHKTHAVMRRMGIEEVT
jgi:hypothetical protein